MTEYENSNQVEVSFSGGNYSSSSEGRENSSSTSISDQFFFFKSAQFTILGVLLIVIVAGNLGVLYTLLFGRSRKSRMNYFIAHLAIADLSVGLINVLTDIIWKITVAWYAGNIACKIIRFLQVWITYASTYVLVALSIDRYDAIRHPMKFSGSWKRAKFLIVSAWLFSGLFSTPILVFYREKEVEGSVQCWIEFDEPWKWKLYMTLVSISIFIIPAAIIANCYAIIIITIWSKNAKGFIRNSNAKKSSIESDSRRASSRGLIPKAKIKTIKITLVIVSVFILCWSPYIVFDLLQVYGQIPATPTSIAVATLIQSLAPLNSAANPIIYCIFSTHFCRTLRALPPFGWVFRKAKKRKCELSSNTQSSSLSEFLTNNKRKIGEETITNAHTVLVH